MIHTDTTINSTEGSKVDLLQKQLQEYVRGLAVGERIMPIRQIMRKYGFSQLTVSQALSRLESRGKIVKTPGVGYFVADKQASTLLRLGFMVPHWPSQGVTELEEMLKLQAKNADCLVSRHDYQVGEQIHNHLPIHDFDVIAIIPEVNLMTPEFIYRIGTAPIPVILCWVPMPGIRLNCVAGDSFVTGAQAASYLIQQGHRKLCVLVSEPMNTSVVQSRVAGFKMIAESNKCELTVIDADVKPGEYSQEKTYKALSSWLKENSCDFTAMYAVSDETAMAGVRALTEHGLRIPEQVSVMGSDGLRQGAFFNPPLTAVSVDAHTVAKSVIAMALKLRKDPSRVLQDNIMPTIVERSSVRELHQDYTPQHRTAQDD